jgi:hypothetical protein
MTHKYDGQIAHLKNHAEESARAITLDVTKRMTATESKLTQQLEKLGNRTRILGKAVGATRSASSRFCDQEDHGEMHGELFYTGYGP